MDVASLWRAIFGGALIGLAAALLLWANGRVVGVSGLLGGVLAPARGDVSWRAVALLGLVLAGIAGALVAPEHISSSPRPLGLLALAGLLVGIGTRLGNGCTSGHGVCGISRLSARSIVATAIFMSSGMLTVFVLRCLGAAP